MKDVNPKIIGGFLIGAIGLIVLIFILFGTGKYFVEKYEYVIYFRDSIEGLSVGSPVKIRGVNIGSVKKITPMFAEDKSFFVEVLIETTGDVIKSLDPTQNQMHYYDELQELIEVGMRARLMSESLVTGKLYIGVDYYPNTEIIMVGLQDDYPEVPSIPTAMEELGAELEKSIRGISEIEFAQISLSLIKTLEGVDTLVRSPELKQTLISLDKSLRATEVLFRNLDGRTDSLTTVLVHNSNTINKFLTNAEKLLVELKEIASTNRYELHEVLRELTKTTEAYYNLADYLSRHPESLLHGKD